MIHRAFPAEVTNGQLRFQESLTDLEGRRVMVVLYDFEPSSKQWPRLTPEALTDDELDAEQDVTFQRPFRWDTVAIRLGWSPELTDGNATSSTQLRKELPT